MLKSISLENYKCFKERTDVEIAPLTILCGVNSSGKSSILKSLLMLKQSYENESTSHSLLLSGEYVDNGTFDDIIYHKNKNDPSEGGAFKIINTFNINDTSDVNGKNLVKRQDIASFKELKKVFLQVPNSKQIKCFSITISIEVMRPKLSKSPFEFYIESNIVKSYNIDLKLLNIQGDPIDNIERYIHVLKNPNETESNDGWILNWDGIPSTKNKVKKGTSYYCTCYFSGLQIKNIYADNMTVEIRSMLPNILAIFKIASFQTDGISFIAPLRQTPARRYSLNGDVSSVGISGEKMPMLLAKEYANTKTDAIPPIFIPNTGKVLWRKKKAFFNQLVNLWMEYLSLGSLSLGDKNGLVEININDHNIVDVGFGVSQALPIIVEGLFMAKDQSLLLEQPEIHLHPEMQLQIADFLIAMANNEKNIIVETHSDHFINRIVRRAMENDDINKLVKIYFFEKDDNGISTKEEVVIDKVEGAMCMNQNFFYQFANETEKIVDVGYNNMAKL